jgi:peptide/nickel transport system substrate-binding protein
LGVQHIQVEVAKGTRLYQIELNNQKIDLRVRRPLNHAVNWDEILGQLYRGYAHRVSTAFLPSGFGYNPDLKPYPYDPEKARALLGQAGYFAR